MLTLWAVVCLPNKERPLEFKWALMWAGPVSLATTKILSFISDANSEILSEIFLFKIQIALIFLTWSNSLGPGATIIFISLSKLSTIKSIKSL